MRKWLLLALGLLAARNPAPTDPVTAYHDSLAVPTTAGAANVVVTGLKSLFPANVRTVRTGEKFWVEFWAETNQYSRIVAVTGNLYYDSTLVRPTGIMDNSLREPIAAVTTNGSQRPGECATAPSANHAAIAGISWKADDQTTPRVKFKFEFLAFAAGSATFSWSPPDSACVGITHADEDFDLKPATVIWKQEIDGAETYYSDTSTYETTGLTVTVEGSTKGNGSFWPSNPESLETYIDLGPNQAASDGDTVTVPIAVWFPNKIGPDDSIGVTIVWETQELEFLDARQVDGWIMTPWNLEDQITYSEPGASTDSLVEVIRASNPRAYEWPRRYDLDYKMLSLTAEICDLDSAAARIFWIKGDTVDRNAKGTVAYMRFKVLRDGNATVKLGCWMPDIPGILDASEWPPYAFDMTYKSGNRVYMLARETPTGNWLWRHGSRGTVVVQ